MLHYDNHFVLHFYIAYSGPVTHTIPVPAGGCGTDHEMNLENLRLKRARLIAKMAEDRRDLAALERVIRMLEKPEPVGTGGTDVQGDAEQTAGDAAAKPTLMMGRPWQSGRSGYACLKPLVERAIRAMNGQFTKMDVRNKVLEMSPESRDQITDNMIGVLLWRLMKKNREEIEIIELGRGRKGTTYLRKS
jgi:hypothetical protein